MVVVYTRTHLWLQLLSFFLLSIFIIISAGFIDARDSKFDRVMDAFNEAKIILLMYHMMLFTDFLPDPITQNKIGIPCSVIIILGTLINMVMIITTPFKSIKKSCRMRYVLKK